MGNFMTHACGVLIVATSGREWGAIGWFAKLGHIFRIHDQSVAWVRLSSITGNTGRDTMLDGF
jgi:hypothetical protein